MSENKICPFLNKLCIENECMLFLDKIEIQKSTSGKVLTAINKKCAINVSAICTAILSVENSK